MLKSAVMSLLLSMSADARPQLPAGVSAAQCPNYPLCSVEQQDLSIFTPAQQVNFLRSRIMFSNVVFFCQVTKFLDNVSDIPIRIFFQIYVVEF